MQDRLYTRSSRSAGHDLARSGFRSSAEAHERTEVRKAGLEYPPNQPLRALALRKLKLWAKDFCVMTVQNANIYGIQVRVCMWRHCLVGLRPGTWSLDERIYTGRCRMAHNGKWISWIWATTEDSKMDMNMDWSASQNQETSWYWTFACFLSCWNDFMYSLKWKYNFVYFLSCWNGFISSFKWRYAPERLINRAPKRGLWLLWLGATLGAVICGWVQRWMQ